MKRETKTEGDNLSLCGNFFAFLMIDDGDCMNYGDKKVENRKTNFPYPIGCVCVERIC